MHFRGVFTIPVTPFTASGELDEYSLRQEVRFCLECGAHGIVAPVNASEFYTLTDAERLRVVELVAEEAGGRIPFVAGCSAVSAQHGMMLARHAEQTGAAAIISMPPVIRKAAGQEIYDYYRALASAVSIPVIVQDFVAPIGTQIPVEVMARMFAEIPGVRYLKEETQFGPHVITAIRERCGDALEGVMGGQGGRFLFDEVARGACGTMPACHLTDVQVDLWNLLESGRTREARALFNRILPLLNFEHLHAVAAYKEVLRRRGVIATSVSRGALTVLDDYDRRELDAILADIETLYRVSL